MATRSPVPGLAEKQCHDVAHRPPHILSQLHRPLLVFIFLSRSFICRDPYVSHLFGRCSLLTGACCISTSIAARSWGIRPPHISHIYASRTLDIDHILLAKLPMKTMQALLFQTKRAQRLPFERHLLGALRLFRHHRL